METGDKEALLAHLKEAYPEAKYGAATEAVLQEIIERAASGQGLPLSGAPKLLPKTFTAPAGAEAGGTYLVNGRKPLTVDLTKPGWGELVPTEPGLYILRHPDGQIHKVGKAETGGLRGRMGDYVEEWVPHLPESGRPLIADLYPQATTNLLTGERVLRGRVVLDGFPLREADGTFRHVSGSLDPKTGVFGTTGPSMGGVWKVTKLPQ